MRFKALLVAIATTLAVPALAQSSPSAFTSGERYDLARRVVGTIAPDPDGSGGLTFAAVRNTYDAEGRLTKVERGSLAAWQSESVAPSGWSGFTVYETVDTVFDLDGTKLDERLTSSGTLRSLTQFKYDGRGQLLCTAVRMNLSSPPSAGADACALSTEGTQGPDRITRTEYDARGWVTKVIKAYGTSLQQDYTTFTYTTGGQVATLTDANGNKSSFAYDGFTRRTHFYFPSPTADGVSSSSDYEQYDYDAGDNRTWFRRRDGQVITYTYDAMSRLLVKDYANNTTAKSLDVSYSYDLRGLQTAALYSSGLGITNSYDNLGRLTSSTDTTTGTSRQLSYTYDKNGNLTELTWPDSVKASWVHDGLDRVSTVHEGTSSGTVLATYSYDALGRRDTVSRGGAASYNGYDGASRLACLGHDLSGGSSVSCASGGSGGSTGDDYRANFDYNPASQIVIRTSQNAAYDWTNHYDVTRGYTANGLNQYTTSGPRTLAYDANGNLAHDGAIAFTYDAENRLVGASGARSTAMAYDPLGRLSQTSGGISGTTQFLYDGDQLVAEYSGGAIIRRYVFALAGDDPLIWYEGSGAGDRRQLFVNHQGSIVAVANASGVRTAINTYGPYGEPTQRHQGRFGYTGQAWLPDLAMWHYKARIYSPNLGRFLQTDPIGYEDQVNLYAYVGNDPMNMADPTGLAKTECERGSISCSSGSLLDMSAERVANFARAFSTHFQQSGLADIPEDLAELAEGLSKGELAWALGGLPPTLGGGLVSGASKTLAVLPAAQAAATTPKIAVIGKVADLQTLRAGERSLLSRLPNMGSPRANWAQNAGVLRREMARGYPIRDASPGAGKSGSFLAAERNLLRDRGWRFNANDSFWYPPAK